MKSIPGMSIRLHHCGFRQKTLKFNSVKAQMWQAENSKNHFGFELAATYATMVHGRVCNPHRCMTTFANVEITSLWRHWWRH